MATQIDPSVGDSRETAVVVPAGGSPPNATGVELVPILGVSVGGGSTQGEADALALFVRAAVVGAGCDEGAEAAARGALAAARCTTLDGLLEIEGLREALAGVPEPAVAALTGAVAAARAMRSTDRGGADAGGAGEGDGEVDQMVEQGCGRGCRGCWRGTPTQLGAAARLTRRNGYLIAVGARGGVRPHGSWRGMQPLVAGGACGGGGGGGNVHAAVACARAAVGDVSIV